MVSKLTQVSALIALLFAASLQAQITINQSDFVLTQGSIYTASVNSDVDTNLWAPYTSGSGGGHTWDFSQMLFTISSQTRVVSTNVPPLSNLFAGATGAWELVGGQSWTFFQSVPNQLYSLGNVSIGHYDAVPGIDTFATVYDFPSLETQFPIGSGSSWISKSQYTTVYSLYSVETRDSVKWIVDAWGTIKYGNRQASALRLKGEWTVWSTTIFPGAPNQTTMISMVQYQYLSKEYGAVTLHRTPSTQRTYVSASADYRFVQAATPVYEVSSSTLPSDFSVEQNSPNPFNPETSIQYSLPKSADVTFNVFNVIGQTVWSENFGHQSAGTYEVRWQGRSSTNESLPSGVYFYRLTAGDNAVTKKMLLLK